MKMVNFLMGGMLGVMMLACDFASQNNERSGVELLSLPATEGFLRADRPRQFSFPRDHGKHPGFRSEWWYLTGNLESAGRRFGYQVTFFRFVIDPKEQSESLWESDAVWLAQAALTDVDNGVFLTSEHLNRELAGLAGATNNGLDVQSNGWRLYQPVPQGPYQLEIQADEFSLSMMLESSKPVVLQGDNGLSQKSADDPLNASYYYSQTRLQTNGELRLFNQQQVEQQLIVTGDSWFDREWSTSALNARQAGWDWFALQLDNQYELMFYRLRLSDSSADAASAGVWVDPVGQVTRLTVDDVQLKPHDFWREPETGKRYPVSWTMTIERLNLELEISAVIPNQHWRGWVRYWEGAVDVRARLMGQPTPGYGYVELTGY